MEVVQEVVMSSLWFLHLQVWFPPCPLFFRPPSSKCIVGQPCNFVLRPCPLFSFSVIVKVCCSSILEDILVVGSSFPFSFSLLVEYKKFWVKFFVFIDVCGK